ncbi:unnamed protein product [Staurois parvus]|uniref:Uncharacterized protein n=1 Tax=Staurois parvus TaxID=386267 RepID=A0ABN9HIK1_9NEOB|nr:unnamed protein product [Staurois parvus]
MALVGGTGGHRWVALVGGHRWVAVLGTGVWHCWVALVGTAGHRWLHCWAQVGALLGTSGLNWWWHCWAPIIRALIISALMIGANPCSDNCQFSAVLSSRSDSVRKVQP